MTVHSLCLPRPQNREESSAFAAILSLAEENELTVWVYDRGSTLDFGVLSLTVSAQTYLERSVHPVFYVSAEIFDKCVLYVSESAHEDSALYHDICQKAQNAEALILSSHGPTSKQNFYCPDCYYIFLNDNSLASHFIPPEDTNTRIVCDSTKISFCFSNK